MRVLFLVHRLPYAPNRGDRIRAYHLLRHLRPHASIEVVSFVDDPADAAQSHLVPADRVTTVSVTPWRNRVRAACLLATARPLTHLLLDAPRVDAIVADAVYRHRPDVVFAFCTGAARLALASAVRDIPLVLDMVDVDSAKWAALGRTTGPPLNWIYRREAAHLERFEASIVSRARTTLVVNAREQLTLARAVPEADIRVIQNGIDVEGFRAPAKCERGPRVVFCGVMNYQPNEEAAVRLIQRIWPRVRAVRPDARLVLVGAHPTPRLARVGASDTTVEVTGSVPDVRPYLWSAAVSVSPLSVARGLQNKVLEALAAGLPVVTTRTVAEGLPSSVLPGCTVTDEDEAIAAEVLRLLAASERARQAMVARADLGGLSWTTQLAQVPDILAAAAGRRRVRIAV
jgi:sugar transferase (PEP-CTERM/EpsH1 system associated)